MAQCTTARSDLAPPRQLAWLLVKQQVALTETERELLDKLRGDEFFVKAYELGQRFVGLVRARNEEGFDAWLQKASCQRYGPSPRHWHRTEKWFEALSGSDGARARSRAMHFKADTVTNQDLLLSLHGLLTRRFEMHGHPAARELAS
jgi:hypothetical protein